MKPALLSLLICVPMTLGCYLGKNHAAILLEQTPSPLGWFDLALTTWSAAFIAFCFRD